MKYELTNKTRDFFGTTLYRIRALKDFAQVKAGDLGGWVQKESNLSQDGDCWIYGYAWVFGNARVFDNVLVYGNARVFGNAQVSGDACVYGNARVYGHAQICGYAQVSGNAQVYGYAQVFDDAQVFGDAQVFDEARVYGELRLKRGAYFSKNITPSMIRSDGYTFTLQSDGSIIAGCRDFTKDQAFEYWGNPDHHLHDESILIVKTLYALAAVRQNIG